jgi:hypothetical protein
MGNKRITLSRPQVAALLSMTEGEVRRLDGERLHPHKGPDGGWLYRPEEVAGVFRQLVFAASVGSTSGVDLATSAEGGIAADAFSRFERGEGAARVVIDLRLNPMLVRDLRRTYDGMTRDLTVSSAERQELERFVGRPIATGRDIIAMISQIAKLRSSPGRTMPDASVLEEDEDYGAVVDSETGEKRALTKEEAERSIALLTKMRSSEVASPKTVAPDVAPAQKEATDGSPSEPADK